MAARLRASATQGSVGAQPNLTVNKPTGTADDDGLVAFIVVDQGTGVTITPPAGWTLDKRADVSTSLSLAVYSKVAASEGANWTWSFAPNAGSVGCVVAVDDSDPADPTDQVDGTTSSSARNVAMPSLFASSGYRLLLAAFAQLGLTSVTPPTEMTEQNDVQGGGLTLEVAYAYLQGPGALPARATEFGATAASAAAGVLILNDNSVTQLYDTAIFDAEQTEKAVFG